MAYNKDEIIKQCYEIIEKESIVFISELVAYLPISNATFYNWHLDKLDGIKDALESSKVKAKASIRKMWATSESPTHSITLYKLLAEEEELRRLSSSHTPKEDAETKRSKFQIGFRK